MILYSNYQLGDIELKNRIVMAPMTRSRAIGNIPNELMAQYYGSRASAGLLITEGTAPSANGVGYARIPGIYSEAQVAGWRKVTDAVHAAGGRIFVQLMHTGRTSHPDNMEPGTEVVAPSAIQLSGEMYTDTQGPQAYPVPKAMTAADVQQAIGEYVQAARNAIAAGFDGVEIHGANGYLVDQFINPASNHRDDAYGGSLENRIRFAIEVAEAVSAAIGPEKTGIRLSPYGVFNDMAIFDDIDATFETLARELGRIGLVYLHIVDHSAMGAPEVPQDIKSRMKAAFGGTFIVSGGLDKASAEAALEAGHGDLTAFGRPFIANPDLVHRMAGDIALAAPDHTTFYTPGEKGYTDYPLATPTSQKS